MGDLSEHFSRSELACKHCGRLVLDPRLVPALEELRSLGDESIIVHDAYRCPIHNVEVGGVPGSEHPNGEAADVEIVGLTLQQMYDRAIKVPAFRDGGIGAYDGKPFLHLDVREGSARWARVSGKYVAITELIQVSST